MFALLPNLSQRNLQPELMDQPTLDAASHRHALRSLARINFLSASAAMLWPAIRDLARTNARRPLRVLDLASGGGDVATRLCRHAERAGLPLDTVGFDISSHSVEFACERARHAGVPAQFEVHDVLHQPLPDGFDVVMCSLFLHHLTNDQAVQLLSRMAAAARQAVLVNDLRREWPGYLLAQLVCRVLTTSRVVRFDGPQSVAAAFTIAEAAQLARQAGLEGVTFHRRWPRRFLLSWHKSDLLRR